MAAAQQQPVRSHFVKKSALLTMENDFKFDFPHAAATATDSIPIEQLDLNKVDEKESSIAPINGELNKSTLLTSDNSFRFNFNVQSD